MTGRDTPDDTNARIERGRPGLGARIAHVTLLGAAVFFLVGVIEALTLCFVETYPEPLAFVRSAVLAFTAAGLIVGAGWGGLCELTVARLRKLARRRFYGISLLVMAVTFVLNICTQKYAWKPLGLIDLGIPLLAILAAEWLPGIVVVLVTALRRPRAGDGAGEVLRRPGRTLLGLLLLVLTLGLLPEVPRRAAATDGPRPPNVVLIVMDTTRFDRLSAFGYSRPTTPVLERLAREGTRFTRAYAAAPWTLPSHAAIFTGLPSATHGATRENMYLSDRHPTLAEALTARGFRSVAISKKEYLWKETGVMRGFTQHFDLFGLRKETALFEAFELLKKWAKIRPRDGGAAQINRVATRWLQTNGDRPFFMFINYNEPHAPLAPPTPFREQYLADRSESLWGREKFPDYAGFSSGSLSYTEQELAIINDLYDAEVAYQDHRLGQLVDTLRARGILDKTLLIVAADHGENLGDHDRIGHAYCLYETLLHVPLVVRLPGTISADVVIDEPITIRKIWSLIEAVLQQPRDGAPLSEADLVAALSSEASDGFVFAEEYRLTPHERAGSRWENAQHEDLARRRIHRWSTSPRRALAQRRTKCVIDSRYKYVWASDGFDEFYDLLVDPLERTNQIDIVSADLERLRQRLKSEEDLWQQAASDSASPMSDEMLERLRELGYIE